MREIVDGEMMKIRRPVNISAWTRRTMRIGRCRHRAMAIGPRGIRRVTGAGLPVPRRLLSLFALLVLGRLILRQRSGERHSRQHCDAK
jgi:hypothetical protein